jgi:hypothetical protein
VLTGGRIVPGPLTDQAVYVILDKRWRQAGGRAKRQARWYGF